MLLYTTDRRTTVIFKQFKPNVFYIIYNYCKNILFTQHLKEKIIQQNVLQKYYRKLFIFNFVLSMLKQH